MRNLKLALRTLFKTPFVTGVAVLSLALGIGPNAAIFSLFDQLLVRELPVQQPDRLVNLSAPGPKQGSLSCNQAGDCDVVFSYPMFKDLEAAHTGLSDIAAHRGFSANLAFNGQTQNGEGTFVSGSYFPLLGIQPALGRLLGPADDEGVGSHFVAVLSYSYWATRLGSDPGVLNQTILVNGQPMTVVGVAPRGFEGTTLGIQPRVFVPISMRDVVSQGFNGFYDRRNYWVYLFGRLQPGVSPEQADAAINGVYRAIINEVEVPLQEEMSEQEMARFRDKVVVVEDGSRGQSSLHADARTPLLLLFAVTGIVLLIACANIANLLLARGANRSMEMVVRLSLGASRRQVLAQLLTESCVLALLGGAASLLMARGTLVFLGLVLPPEALAFLELELHPSVFLFAAVVAIGAGLLFGIFPALHSTRPDLASTIRANAGQVAGGGKSAARFRSTLVVAQIGLSMMLLVSAGLFLKSLLNVGRIDLGMQPENLLTFSISPELNGYAPERSRALFQRLEEELAGIPGVTGVTDAIVPVVAGSNWVTGVAVEGFEGGADVDSNARLNKVGPDYFRTLGMPLLAGREITLEDAEGAEKVAVVNETFAEKFGLGRNPIGKFMSTDVGRDARLDTRIIGLVEDAKYSNIKDEVPPVFFTPYRQDENIGGLDFYVRTAGDPRDLLRSVPAAVARVDPNLPVEGLKTMPQQVRENLLLDRTISTLSAAFAILATLLAAGGLYGVLGYMVARRTREIGVRIALGASVLRIRAMVLRQVGRMMVFGGLAGIAAALAIARAARSVLYGLEGTDPVVLTLAVVVLGLVTFGAGYLPARRAARVNPVDALRYE